MPQISATIYDISQDQPRSTDRFLVDTNIWFWHTYANASAIGQTTAQRFAPYLSYLNKCKQGNLYFSPLSVAELAHSIERAEYKLYLKQNPTINEDDFKLKDFRYDQQLRVNTLSHITNSLKQIKSAATFLDTVIDQNISDRSFGSLNQRYADGYDVLLIDTAVDMGIFNFITDDKDYATVAGIHVFIANKEIINTAKNVKKLILR